MNFSPAAIKTGLVSVSVCQPLDVSVRNSCEPNNFPSADQTWAECPPWSPSYLKKDTFLTHPSWFVERLTPSSSAASPLACDGGTDPSKICELEPKERSAVNEPAISALPFFVL